VKHWVYAGGGVAAGLALAFGLVAPDHRNSAAAQSEAQRLAAEAAGPQPASVSPPTGAALAATYAPVVKRVAPAIVNIYTARRVVDRQTMADFFGMMMRGAPRARVERSLGSGVIVAGDGLIITNNHVVAGAEEILVALADRREFPAKVVFADEKTDLAALRIDPGGMRLPTAALGDSDRAQVGDVVLAIGNPFGVGQTVTEGIVSAIARNAGGVNDWQFFLQTDAAINPGNSGGALIDTTGRVIGINTAIFSRSGGSNGIGFAIPANMVRQFITAAGSGRLVRAWIGAAGDAITQDIAARAGFDRPTGVILTSVTPGSPAARAGLRPGDILYAFDGKELPDPASLSYRVATQEVGREATLTVVRGGRAMNIRVTLAAPPADPPATPTQIGNGSLLAGVTVANLSPALAQELGQGLPDRGVVVLEVAQGAPAAQLGLAQPGDLIEAVNGRAVGDVASLRAQLAAVANGVQSVRVNRGGQRAECLYRPPGAFSCRS